MNRGLSQYRLLRRLGSGGQAEVYLAFDTRLKRRVCIKLYHLTGSLSVRRRAVAEARHLMRVDSPHTVAIHDVVSAGPHLALVVQYVPGCSLEDLLARVHRLAPANALALVTDLAAALAALRRAAVVHGDMKPANVLVTPSGRAVLTDFGAAQLVGEQWLAGSPEALSPEQSRGEMADLGSDFFSLGLLLHRMLFGVHPFFTGSELDVRRLRGGLKKLPNMPGVGESEAEAIKVLLQMLLAAERADRPEGTFELRECLRELRSLLPAANFAELPLHTVTEPVPAGVSAARLPQKLVRLPLGQKARALFMDYWARGSSGARSLLIASMLVPCVVLGLVMLMPGPCISVAMPQVNVLHDTKMLAATEEQLRVLLSLLLKERVEDAVVLGAGLASDNKYTLTSAGSSNVCIAQRELSLQVDCASGRCLLQLRGSRDSRRQEQQLSLPQGATLPQLKQALSQLLDELGRFLIT
ncbi:serine/threonine-protein kinase [Congregibacter variabilis]|uniref:Serine/threonine-protein kinase n=1 Tax=Congregibacter variabilis TaxID=3081200 RepID=A0ABZ0I798_9GAMM|nr:serine/threonine-protein kinase [Congregibacter sp. IMCC43200]